MKLKINLIILIIIGLISPSLAFLQVQQISPPETLEEAKERGEKALESTEKELPGILEGIWKEDVLPFWQKMYGWFKAHVWPKIEGWFKRIRAPIQEEIEKRKPIIKEEFQIEKEELKEEAPKVGKTLWEKFKELIR